MNKIMVFLMISASILLMNCDKTNKEKQAPITKKVLKIELGYKIASPKQVTFLKEMIKNGTIIGQVYYVKSPDFQNVYFIAAKVLDNSDNYLDIGVWSMSGDKDNPGMTFSVNSHAKKLCYCSSGPATMNDAGALDLKRYVEKIKN